MRHIREQENRLDRIQGRIADALRVSDELLAEIARVEAYIAAKRRGAK